MSCPGVRLVAVFAIAVVAVSGVATVPPEPALAQAGGFADVAEDAYFSEPVVSLAERGVFAGTGCDEGFCPDAPIDRKTMAVWVVRMLDGVDPAAVTESQFDDVDAHSFHAAFIERMAELEVTGGCGDGSGFCPDRAVTRAQMAVFLSRAYRLPDAPDPGFADVPSGEWYAADVARLAASGITSGCKDGTVFCPGSDTTRAQMATFLHRAMNTGPLSVRLESSAPRAVTGSYEVEVTFARSVNGFAVGDIEVANGRAGGLSGSGSHYTATITAAAEGTVVVRVPQGAARDAAGNLSQASGLLVRILGSGTHRDGPGFDVWNREAVIGAYRAEFEREQPDLGFTGSVADCEAGTTSQAFRDSVVQRVNWYRQMAGLDTVTEDPSRSDRAQRKALIMSAQGRLSHYPPPDWACYTEVIIGGGENLGLGSIGVRGVNRYMQDRGSNNLAVGHRRQILSPFVTRIGTGDVAEAGGRAANAMHFEYSYSGNTAVRERRGFVAWPPAGYVPSQTVWGRWSFQLGGADFGSATVTVTDDYGPIPVAVIHRSRAMVWAVHRDWDSLEFPRFTDRDHCYTVTISNVTVAGATQLPFQYVTCLIDAGTESANRSRYVSPPLWSPDGTQVAFGRDGGTWVINANGTGQRLFFLLASRIRVKWSPDSTRIAYGGDGIWVANTDGTGQQQLTTSRASPDAWSPDSTRIAYITYTGLGWTAKSTGVWVANADGTGQQQLTTSGRSPAWSPDGTRIAYTDNGIWVINADGTNPQQLTTSRSSPAWSPDGTRIAYTDNGIWVVNADGTNPQQLTTSGRSPAWSPDGTRIAYTDNGIWVVNADGTNPRQLTTSRSSPAWSPDGARIAYGGNGIWVVNTDGTGQRQLTNSGDGPAWSPDGTRIAYNEWGHQLWVVNADGTNPRQLSQ